MNRDSFNDILNHNYVAITQGNGYKNSFDNCLAYSNSKLPINNFSDLQNQLKNIESVVITNHVVDLFWFHACRDVDVGI